MVLLNYGMLIMESITCVVFSPSDKYIVLGVYNGIVRLYETETGNMLREIKCPFTKINSMEFSEDGEYLLLSDLDKDEVKINFHQGIQDIIKPEITLFKEYNNYKNNFIQIEQKKEEQKDLEEEPMLKLEKKTSPKVEKDLLENKGFNYQKNSFLENIKREINTVKSLFSLGVDKQDILKEIGFLTESNLDYIIQHLDDTDVDILGKLE